MKKLKDSPMLLSLCMNAALFVIMLLIFVPYAENPADSIYRAPAFFVIMWILSFAVLTVLAYAVFETCESLAGRLMAAGCLIYLAYECYVQPNAVKLILIAASTAVCAATALRKDDKKGMSLILAGVPAVIAACGIIYLMISTENGSYSIAGTMPDMDPFIYGKLRYHSILSAMKDYLKYEPRTILRVPVLYLWLFMAYIETLYAGKKARSAVLISFVVWNAAVFIGRAFSVIGYYWVYTAAFIPAVFILLYFVKYVEIPEERRMWVHTALVVILPVVIFNTQYTDHVRLSGEVGKGLYSSERSVYLYEVNPYELTGK